MPTVPSSQGPRAQLGAAPNVRLTTPDVTTPEARLNTPQINLPGLSTPKLEATLSRPGVADPNAIDRIRVSDKGAGQFVAAGNNLIGASEALGRVAMQMQLKVNATVVDDALNSAHEAARTLTYGKADGKGGMVGGYRNAKGWDAIKRPSGKPIDDEVAEEFDRSVKEIAKNKITNADQRAAFERQVADLASRLREGAAIHQAQEFDTYHTGVYKGMVENRTASFALLNPGDRDSQRETMAQIEGAVATLAEHRGDSAQVLEVGLRAARGAAVASLFDKVVAEKKYDTAQGLLNEWGSKIDANTATKMKAALDGHVSIQLGEQIAEDTWKHWAAPAYEAGDPDRAHNVLLATEARGTPRHVDEKGKLVVSPKGAYGVGQLMPETAERKAKELGRPELYELSKQPTREGEAANRVLSKAIFQDLVTKFNGDIPKAFAAYNAGPGWLVGGKDTKGNKIEGALKIAARTGTDWREHLPQETRDYLSYAMKSFGSGEGRPRKAKRQELLDAVDARTTDPDVRRAAYSWLDRRNSAAEADEREGYETSYAQGLRIVRETGGNLNAIPPELKAKIKPEQFTTLQTYAQSTAAGQYTSTKPEAYWSAMTAASQPGTTPAQLEAFRTELNESDFNTVRSAYIQARKPEAGKGPGDLDFSRADDLVDTQLEFRGVNTKPGKTDKADIARLGAVRQFAHKYLLDRQRQLGKKFTDAEIEQEVTQLFTRNQSFKSTWLGVNTGGGAMNVMTAKVSDLPVDTRKRLVGALEKGLGRKPTDAEVLASYFRTQFYTGVSGGR